jgi:hypothetical protein
MMFVDNPTEQTTAATDAILALLALGGLILLLRLKSGEPSKVRIWSVALGCLAVASAAGAVAHGVQVSQRVHDLLWLAIYLCLGLLVASFTIGTVYDLWGEGAARRIAPVMIVIAFLFFAGPRSATARSRCSWSTRRWP